MCIRDSLLEEDIVLRAGLRPFVELVHELNVACEMINWLHLEKCHSVMDTSLSLTKRTAVDHAYTPLFKLRAGLL